MLTGNRAEELALRLKYAGYDMTKVSTENSLGEAIEIGLIGSGRLFVLPTYTVLLAMERMFAKTGLKKEYLES